MSQITWGLSNYRTSKQQELIAMLKDPEVNKSANEIILENMRDFVPFNFSDYLIHTEGDYPGRLRDSGFATANAIIWRTPYAHYVWVGEVYGVNIPITASGVKNVPSDPSQWAPAIGFYSPKGVTKTPKDQEMQYSTAGTGKRWVDLAMKSQTSRTINNQVTWYLKRECKKRGLNT